MVRHVFFSFHYDRDNWRAGQVRNSRVTQDLDVAGYVDAADWEEIKQQSDSAIESWIDDQLHGTSVTAVLIGEETAERDFVQYEIERSFERDNALLGIRIHGLKDKESREGWDGRNPLKDYVFETESGERRLSEVYPTYDWRRDDGRENIGKWVEEAVDANNQVPREARDTLERDKSSLLDTLITGAIVGVGIKIGAELVDEFSGNLK